MRTIIWLGAAIWIWTLPVLASGPSANIAAGSYRPFYGVGDETVAVSAFRLDVYPVTNGAFLKFVRDHPKWQRDAVTTLFADESYLSHWEAQLQLGNLAPAEAPVTNVSWFAARAYCDSKQGRLPTMDEWERAAAASADAAEPEDKDAFNQRILDWYSKPTRLPLPKIGQTYRNYWGVWDLHGLVWEWVEDFSSLMTTGASRKDAGGLDRQLFCAAGSVGSADPSNYAAFMRYAMRGSVQARHAVQNLGFRCAWDSPAVLIPEVK